MSVVDDPLQIPSKREDRRWVLKQATKVVAAIVITGGTVALVVTSATSNSQQETINRNNQAALCRSQVVAETDGVINGSLNLLLRDPQADGIIEILDSIVLLGNRVPLNFEEIASVSQDIKDAQTERVAYVKSVSDAIKRREQAIQACEPTKENS